VKTEPTITTAPVEPVNAGATAKIDSSKTIFIRLSVVFFSIGSGTDNKAMRAFEDLISSFAIKSGKNIDYKKCHGAGKVRQITLALRLNQLGEKNQGGICETRPLKL
ncbi:MAG: hypothetical protein IPN61_00365, partial [Bacteroidetes bacterium]|nr:hypothetical protein [Bacteroidota bacterium]